MKKMLRKLYGKWLASWIERASRHPDYSANMPFLCQVILNRFKSPFRYQVLAHIRQMVGFNLTLRFHMSNAGIDIPDRWEGREVYHRRFWELKCQALRNGDLEWGRYPESFAKELKELTHVSENV